MKNELLQCGEVLIGRILEVREFDPSETKKNFRIL